MQRVVIVDYGSGNLHSAHKAVERAAREAEINVDVAVSSDAKAVVAADRVILPGVGAFADCKSGLAAVPGMIEALNEFAMERAKPFLGICVGMQLMATRGLEFGETAGLGWIDGDVTTIEPQDTALKVPHMGWNTLSASRDHALLDGIKLGPEGRHAYFVHSFHLVANDSSHIIATTDYGGPITAMVGRDNIVGTQFHPEKSQILGLRLLTNFLNWKV
ncbi:MAG: glutamine amidotransferase [Alphaproteobacteria bacterium]|jgi:glutamine amidotransferase